MTTPQSIRPLVLVADDDEDILALVTFSLRRDGYEVVQARDGAEALELVERLKPDVVLMDISMPVMDGIEATKQISAAHPRVAVLMLTGSNARIDVDRARKAGAAGYVTKDKIAAELIEAILQARGG